VLALVGERRQPGRVEDGGDRCGERGGPPAVTYRDNRHDGEREREEEPPVVRVEQSRERDAEQRQEPPPAEDDAVDIRADDDERERRDQRVHPRLLGVVGEERIDCGEGGADPARQAPEERTPDPVRERDAREREVERERVRRALAVTEPADPNVQQQVVQRRRAVLTEQVRDRREVVVRDPDGQTFVDPEAAAEKARADPQREADQGKERRRARPRRQRRHVQAARAKAIDRCGHRRHGATLSSRRRASGA
jgi:hypothetical protein